jgi:hypothetical protein
MSSEILVLKSALGLAGLWIFVFYFWQDYRLDAFREHVFSLRDRLFLFAAEGGISFEDRAYKILRDRTNIALRYAHEFTLVRMALIMCYPFRNQKSESQKWMGAVQAIDSEDTRRSLEEFNTVLSIAILQLIIYRSFFRYLLIRPIMTMIQIRDVLTKRPEVVQGVEQLESEAIKEARAHDKQLVAVG